jgi:hypothetical protein
MRELLLSDDMDELAATIGGGEILSRRVSDGQRW